jgi:hypothetical protein
MRYFTVLGATAADISAADSGVSGIDSNGVQCALLKFKDGTTIPTFDGVPVELYNDEHQIAAQSSIYTGSGFGNKYRQNAVKFGTMVAAAYIDVASQISVEAADRAQVLFADAEEAAFAGFIELLRFRLIKVPVKNDIGYTATVKAQLVGLCDGFLAKFPAKETKLPSVVGSEPQLKTIDDSSNGSVLLIGERYFVPSSSSAFSVELPPHGEQCSPTRPPITIENFSSQTVTVNVNSVDTTAVFRSGGTSISVLAGERIQLETAIDGSTPIWVNR